MNIRSKIATKLTFLMGGLIAFMVMAIAFTVSVYVEKSLKESNHELCIATAEYLGRYIRTPLITSDLYTLHEYFEDTTQQGLFSYAILLDDHGKVLMHSDLAEINNIYNDVQSTRAQEAQKIKISQPYINQYGQPADEIFVPVVAAGIKLGTIRLGHSHATIQQTIIATRNWILMVGFIVALVSLAIAYILATFFTKPIRNMTLATQRVARGNLSAPVPVNSNDELGTLAESFNRMTDELRATTVSRDYLNNIFDSAGDAIRSINWEYDIVMYNRSMADLLNSAFTEEPVRKCHELLWFGICNSENCVMKLVQKSMQPIQLETHAELHDGRKRFVRLTATPLMENGQVIGVIESIQDISARKEAQDESISLQRQLVQAQKMESVGRLAGGVAHDFNNLLSVIIGYTELALLTVSKEDPVADKLRQVGYASRKAESLVRQLLAFSRKQILEMAVIDINEVIDNMMKMLHRIIGEDITLVLSTSTPVKHVFADQSQLVQILMNLAVNARDAMPNGGKLSIETSDIILTEEDSNLPNYVTPGEYVLLTITDTGIGMTNDLTSKIFEPFFTTKGPESGTGLGLSTVYGTIKQHNGYIYVESEPDIGTTFKIYLPASDQKGKAETSQISWQERRGTETILIVDDEQNIRELLVDTLEPLGYKLLIATTGEEALKLSKSAETDIDLLLTDVVMPGMNGWELAKEFLQQRPGTKTIFMSGYAHNLVMQNDLMEEEMFYIQKPITPSILAKKLRQVLDDEKTTADST